MFQPCVACEPIYNAVPEKFASEFICHNNVTTAAILSNPEKLDKRQFIKEVIVVNYDTSDIQSSYSSDSNSSSSSSSSSGIDYHV
ncbi:hypothetical protein ACTXT7_005033 [Hymenolepis weldensis]